MRTLDEYLVEKLARDPAFRKEWERSEPLYSVIAAVLRRRNELGLSQKDLAERMGKQQPAIARFEAGNAENPTLGFLQQLAEALDMQVTVHLAPRSETSTAVRRIAEERTNYSAT